MKSEQIYVANTTGFIHLGDDDVKITRGVTRVRDGHPLLKAAPKFFDPISVDYDVEAATAAPGAKR